MQAHAKSQCVLIGLSLLLIGVVPNRTSGTSKSPDLEAEKQMDIEWGKPTEGVVCAVSTDRKNKRFGFEDPIWVELRTKNTSSKEIKVVQTNLLSAFKLVVIGPDNKPSPLTLYGNRESEFSGAERSVHTIKPGEEDRPERVLLNRYFDMTLPGEYLVSFSRKAILPNQKNPVTVTSNKLRIKNTGELKAQKEK